MVAYLDQRHLYRVQLVRYVWRDRRKQNKYVNFGMRNRWNKSNLRKNVLDEKQLLGSSEESFLGSKIQVLLIIFKGSISSTVFGLYKEGEGEREK